MILNVNVEKTKTYQLYATNTLRDFDKVNNNNWRFRGTTALKTLYEEIKFQQIRFYCKKEGHNRVIDIATKTDAKGKAVLDYMLGFTDTVPAACGSYDRLEGDTSELTAHCGWWNRNVWSFDTSGPVRSRSTLVSFAILPTCATNVLCWWRM